MTHLVAIVRAWWGIAQSTSFNPSLESRNNNLAGYRSVSQGRLSNFDASVVSTYKNGSSRASGYLLPDLNTDENSELASGSTFRRSKFIKVPLPTFSGDRRVWVDFRLIWRMRTADTIIILNVHGP
ncbi:hypothetical protein EB796_024644 [Bugula neritina]|uniref:Uncharacterized protein n=1 Tax=Bugula neritina TaxID=10212 RepID=A0A7J7IUG0_BUGNE|nr:hypothetical protein EB796_024644 [Bugula neritina]